MNEHNNNSNRTKNKNKNNHQNNMWWVIIGRVTRCGQDVPMEGRLWGRLGTTVTLLNPLIQGRVGAVNDATRERFTTPLDFSSVVFQTRDYGLEASSLDTTGKQIRYQLNSTSSATRQKGQSTSQTKQYKPQQSSRCCTDTSYRLTSEQRGEGRTWVELSRGVEVRSIT